MQRRTFIKESGMVALSLGVFGNIRWENDRFVGDTTTDILGPFYRPGAPLRTNINPEGFTGEILHLSGTILKSDGKTPFQILSPRNLLDILLALIRMSTGPRIYI
jgi:catechol 1,2-dioxygenase